jgi:4-carboxymuconolactone decarboxylase
LEEKQSERYRMGLRVGHEIWGAKFDEMMRSSSEIDPDLERYTVEYVFGDVYNRPGLDLKTRSLCTVAALTVLGRRNQLRFHLEGAVKNGASKREILEVLIQMSVYGGFPAAWDGLSTAREVFTKLGMKD